MPNDTESPDHAGLRSGPDEEMIQRFSDDAQAIVKRANATAGTYTEILHFGILCFNAGRDSQAAEMATLRADNAELQKEVNALAGQVQELTAEIERKDAMVTGTIDRETLLSGLNYNYGELFIGMKPPQFVMHVLALMFAEAIDGAENFQTSELNLKAERYEMTIRRIDGISPAVKIGQLQQEIAELKAHRVREALAEEEG